MGMGRVAAGDSAGNPIEVDWVDAADLGVLGALGRTFLPGKNHVGLSGIVHRRSARDDVRRLRRVHDVDALVLLNEDHEILRFVDDPPPPAAPQDLRAELAASQIELLRLPIPDGGTPRRSDEPALRALLDDIILSIRSGRAVTVACRGGLGRTGTILALLLVELGCDADEAIRRVRAARGGCIDPGDQEAYVRSWRRSQDELRDRLERNSLRRRIGEPPLHHITDEERALLRSQHRVGRLGSVAENGSVMHCGNYLAMADPMQVELFNIDARARAGFPPEELPADKRAELRRSWADAQKRAAKERRRRTRGWWDAVWI